MTHTQIQLPDELYKRATAFAEDRQISFAEITRRGLELFLSRFPDTRSSDASWQLPTVDGGGIRVPLADLHNMAAEEKIRILPIR